MAKVIIPTPPIRIEMKTIKLGMHCTKSKKKIPPIAAVSIPSFIPS